jgi:hypothetical protein
MNRKLFLDLNFKQLVESPDLRSVINKKWLDKFYNPPKSDGNDGEMALEK